jgi:hypothetical protein
MVCKGDRFQRLETNHRADIKPYGVGVISFRQTPLVVQQFAVVSRTRRFLHICSTLTPYSQKAISQLYLHQPFPYCFFDRYAKALAGEARQLFSRPESLFVLDA